VPEEAEVGAAEVEALGCEEAVMVVLDSVVSVAASTVAGSVGAFEEGSVMFTSLATAEGEI
jgi:hypothetical protein